MRELPSIELRVCNDDARDGMFIKLDLVHGAHGPTVCELFCADHLGNRFTALP